MTSHAVLDHNLHRNLRVRAGASAKLGDGVMACITVPTEFRRIQNEFPILFRRDIENGRFSALALLGFENGENLFLGQSGGWDARYKPLALSIQPFLVGRADDAADAQVHVDTDHPRVAGSGEEGIRAFDDHGAPTPYLEAIIAGLDELHQGYQASGAFFDALEQHELLEPFSLDVELRDGSSHRLVGYHMIDEAKLRSLDGAVLGELHAADHLLPIFMAIASLSNFSALIARKNAKLGHG